MHTSWMWNESITGSFKIKSKKRWTSNALTWDHSFRRSIHLLEPLSEQFMFKVRFWRRIMDRNSWSSGAGVVSGHILAVVFAIFSFGTLFKAKMKLVDLWSLKMFKKLLGNTVRLLRTLTIFQTHWWRKYLQPKFEINHGNFNNGSFRNFGESPSRHRHILFRLPSGLQFF